MKRLLGTIVKKDGLICLETLTNCWYPLGGNSSIAVEFQETFNTPAQSDIGRQLWRVNGVICMESIEEMRKRKGEA